MAFENKDINANKECVVKRKRKAEENFTAAVSGCRFIPKRDACFETGANSFDKTDLENNSNFGNTEQSEASPATQLHQKLMTEAVGVKKQRILSFSVAPKPRVDSFEDILKRESEARAKAKTKNLRHIPKTPLRILDAPDFENDFYLNNLDWSNDNILSVALADSIYLWNAERAEIRTLYSLSDVLGDNAVCDDIITSLKFSTVNSNTLAVGTSNKETLLFNTETNKLIRKLKGHNGRVSCLTWNDSTLTTGSEDSVIINHDVRVKNSVSSVLKGHSQEVCSLSWKQDGVRVASGANDNLVNIFDIRTSSYLGEKECVKPELSLVGHKSCVKGLAFSPFYNNMLVTGGGSGCKTVKLWNTQSGELVKSQFVGDAVSSIVFNPFSNEFVATTGNTVCLFEYPTVLKLKELSGHEERILTTALSPCGTVLCSAAADETLRFWQIFADDTVKSVETVGKRAKNHDTPDFATNFKLR